MKDGMAFDVTFILFCIVVFGGFWAVDTVKSVRAELKDSQIEIAAMHSTVGQQAEYISTLQMLIGKLKEYQQFDQYSPEQITGLATMILEQAALYSDVGITPSLIMAVMEKESGFDPNAVSSVRATGLMQVRRAAAQETLERLGYTYSVALMQDPILSTKVGTEYLVWLHRLFMSEGVETRDDWQYTLMAYNNGPTAAFAFVAGDAIIVNGEYAASVTRLRGHYEVSILE